MIVVSAVFDLVVGVLALMKLANAQNDDER